MIHINSKGRRPGSAALVAFLLCAASFSAQAAPKDPLFAPNHHRLPPAKANINFQVDFEGGSFPFVGALKLYQGALSGTVTAPSGCVGDVLSGSTDSKGKLNLQVTFGGDCDGEAGSFVGKLKFKKGTGTGTFTDPYGSGPYVASKIE